MLVIQTPSKCHLPSSWGLWTRGLQGELPANSLYLPCRFQSPNLGQAFFRLLQAPSPPINYLQLLHTFILLVWPKSISVCNLLFSRLVLGLATLDQLVLYQNEGKLQFLPQTTSTTSVDTLSELSPKERVNWCSDPDTPNGPHRGQNVGALRTQALPLPSTSWLLQLCW